MFEKTLTDLIRGIRANKKNEEKYIATCLDEIRNEVRKNDPDVKAGAVRKLIYLHMHGYDMAWASFHVIEVMSSPKLQYKRIGYQAAAVSFKQDTDVLMLCTNLIKKDLSSNNYNETALALHGLAMIVTPDLGRDLTSDLIAMMNHSRPYIRKRVILVLYRVFLKYPEALRLAFPRLKEKLDDPEPAVVSAVVNVICELARRNPKSYLPLAPHLYGLLTNSTNNWMLIKIIKLFASLTPLEPRLTKKLVPQITNLIQSTSAMSLLYECIHTVIVGGMIGPETVGGENEAQDEALASLCTSKLKIFIAEPDQNLKYLGLYALSKLLAVRPKAVVEHRDTILNCLDDADVSIRMRALDIVTGMVTPTNLVQITRKLIKQVIPPEKDKSLPSSYPPPSLNPVLDSNDRTQVITRIISICSKDTYANVTNFEWYITVLVDLIRAKGVDVGNLIAAQLVDVAVRVMEVREFAVDAMAALLADEALLLSATQEKNNTSVLWAAAWIVGEFSTFLQDPVSILGCLTTRGVEGLPPMVQAAYLQNLFKVYVFWATSKISAEQLVEITTTVLRGLERFKTSSDLEVQERACEIFEIVDLVPRDEMGGDQDGAGATTTIATRNAFVNELQGLFAGEMNPVGVKAQKRVTVPEGLDLDKWICEPEPEPVDEDDSADESESARFWNNGATNGAGGARRQQQQHQESMDPEEAERRRADRLERRKYDPFYIPPSPTSSNRPLYDDIDVNEIPIVKLNFDGTSSSSDPTATKGKTTKKSSSKHAKQRAASPPPPQPPTKSYNINRGAEMPEGIGHSNDAISPVDDEEQHMDEITKAVMSVDLTRDHNEDPPVHNPTPYNAEILVTRKKTPKAPKAKVDDGEIKLKKKKKKKAVVANEDGEGDASAVKKPKRKKSATKSPKIDNKGLLAVRGIDSDAPPYERLASPAPPSASLSAADKSEDNNEAETVLPPQEEHSDFAGARDWICVGGDDDLSVHFDWQRLVLEETDTNVHVKLYFQFTNTSITSTYAFPNPLTLTWRTGQDTRTTALTIPTLRAHSPYVNSTTIDLPVASPADVPSSLDPTSTGASTPLLGHCDLVLSGFEKQPPIEFALPVTLNFVTASDGGNPAPSPDEFTGYLKDASGLHTSSTQFHIPASPTNSIQQQDIVAKIASRLRMTVVETIDGAATLWAWMGVSGHESDGQWCAALVRVGKGVRGAWVVKVEVRALDLAVVDGVVGEVHVPLI
ncbi:hypothetical protein PhCBS80983_g01081 [Powellomyces hirtus]|uniref:AP-3 complex subunit delta n=1 Tax=Powellomyces hirtus TaxID=109895 RepID=A0A507EC69_9FUNG|nr:hypothetical protein PhCBS80983_g01081 [Powellomyces hirtus]